jgi:hypothetical protein
MELDLQSLFGLHEHRCTHWLRPWAKTLQTPPPLYPPLPAFGLIFEGLLAIYDRRHLFVTPCVDAKHGAKGDMDILRNQSSVRDDWAITVK